MLAPKLKAICSSAELRASPYREQLILYKGKPVSALIFIYKDKTYSYINHCMHMQRRLNCEEPVIFDETGRYLRCSMHGFLFDPSNGECQSPVCYGQRLQSLHLEEIDGIVYFAEKHLILAEQVEIL